MNRENIVDDAVPAAFFAHPPYIAELFSEVSGWAGVMNANNFNALTFKSNRGRVVTDYETAQKIADKWNQQANQTAITITKA